MADTPSKPAEAGPPAVARAFALLHPGVQRQLWRMGWTRLRQLQVDAIAQFAADDAPLVLAAATAAGKTEAAFLPILSAIADDSPGSVRAVYVGPLKALINDQFARVEELCEYLDVPVFRWHGDVPASHKERLVKQPGGVLLITPESLESLFVNRSNYLAALFGGLRYVVIDELHSFLDSGRGVHLRSLLARVLRVVRTPGGYRALGLSATLGDFSVARRHLCPDAPDRVRVIQGVDGQKEIRYRIYGYRVPASLEAEEEHPDRTLDPSYRTAVDIADHCAGAANLVFADRRTDVEHYADECRHIAATRGLRDIFLVHHGSLSTDLRVEAEETMKQGAIATTFCSSTLEMGIDIGSVRAVGQIGAPWSVASLKQRLGRSGRKPEEPHVMRVYVQCREPDAEDDVFDRLHLELVQAVAVTELMLGRWVEPASLPLCDLSTLTQQVISVVAETGGAAAAELYDRLCIRGPFREVEPQLFARLLRQLGSRDVVEQMQGGDMILGLEGERLRRHRGFYAVFPTPEEYTLLHDGVVLGTLEVVIDGGYRRDDHLLFAGRRWRIVDVDEDRLLIHLTPASGRKHAKFKSGAGEVHPRVREAMRDVLAGGGRLGYLNAEARSLLDDARAAASHAGLLSRCVITLGPNRTALLTWTGTRVQQTLIAMLAAIGVEAVDCEIGLIIENHRDAVLKHIATVFAAGMGANDVAPFCRGAQARKYDWLLGEDLLGTSCARGYVELDTALHTLRAIADAAGS